jgi:hypothetical protein
MDTAKSELQSRLDLLYPVHAREEGTSGYFSSRNSPIDGNLLLKNVDMKVPMTAQPMPRK